MRKDKKKDSTKASKARAKARRPETSKKGSQPVAKQPKAEKSVTKGKSGASRGVSTLTFSARQRLFDLAKIEKEKAKAEAKIKSLKEAEKLRAERNAKEMERKAADKAAKERDLERKKLEKMLAKNPQLLYRKSARHNFKRARLFITSAALGSDVHHGFLNSILNYCKRFDAVPVILPTHPHLPALSNEVRPLHPRLTQQFRDAIYTEFVVNEHLKAIDAEIPGQQVNGVEKLERLAKPESRMSLIVAHTKQHMKTLPTGLASLPRVIQFTGSCTLPDYRPNNVGEVAKNDHVVGGIVVEVDGDCFHHWQVQASEDGSFSLHEMRFLPDGQVTRTRPALMLGDWHTGYIDPDARKVAYAQLKQLKPSHVILQDIFDGASISHHKEGDMKAKLDTPSSIATLESELNELLKELQLFESLSPQDAEIIMLAANHNDFLSRMLRKPVRWVNDIVNFKKIVELAHYFYNFDQDPIKKVCDPEGNRFTWVSSREDRRIYGVHVSHGHLGINGAKGSSKGINASVGKSMHGHTHTPCIHHSTYCVGTNSLRFLDYNDGFSSWLWANGLIHEDGSQQLLCSVKGRWRLDDTTFENALKIKVKRSDISWQPKGANLEELQNFEQQLKARRETSGVDQIVSRIKELSIGSVA